MIPALFTRMSRRPTREMMSSISDCGPAGSEKSVTMPSNSGSGLRCAVKTVAPSSRKRLAMARPIPVLPPVTRTTLSSNLFFCSPFVCLYGEGHQTLPDRDRRLEHDLRYSLLFRLRVGPEAVLRTDDRQGGEQ